MDANQIPPSIPFHAARAYGVSRNAAPIRNSSGLTVFPVPVAEPIDQVDLRSRAASTSARRLVAASVPGRIDFAAAQPAPSAPRTDAIPMYRHPADKNAAATALSLGRTLDLNA